MLGFSPLTAGPLAATAGTAADAPLTISAAIAVTGTGIANRIVNSGTTSGTLAVTGTGVARGVFHASTDTPTTITAAITATGVASRIAASNTASGTFAVTGTAVATSIEVVLLANVDITATGAAEAIRVRGLDSTTGNDIAITDDVRASAVFGAVGSGDVASTGTGTASRVLGVTGSGTAAFSGTALVLPDPTNYATKDVLTSTTSAGTTFTGTASPPIRYQYAIGTGGVAITGTGTPTGVFSAQASGTVAITGTALHHAGQKYVLGSGAVSVVGTSPQILIVVSAVPATTTITASVTAAPYIRLRQLDGSAAAPVATGTCGEALRFRLVDGTADVASTGTGITSAILSAQGIGDTAATVTGVAGAVLGTQGLGSIAATATAEATAIKIRIMSPASGSIAVTEAASAIRVRGLIGSATGAATATADGIVFTLKLMQAVSDVAVTEVADVQRILPRIGAAAIAATASSDNRALFSPSVDGRITCGSFAQIFRSQTSERTDAIVQRYSRRVLPTGELRDTLGNEFQNIERTLSSVTEATILLTDVEPETKRRGMVRYAVTPWIPVAGHSGLVVYDGNTWAAV